MPKVRGNGSGCITKCKDGRKSLYRVSITIGYETDPVTGNRKQLTKSLRYFKTRKLAEEELVKYNVKECKLKNLYCVLCGNYFEPSISSVFLYEGDVDDDTN